MADYIGRESAENPGGLSCEQWEALLADKIDAMDETSVDGGSGELAPLGDPAAERAFVEHSRDCAGCGSQLEQARQGREWLKLLNRSVPPAPAHLLSRILASTEGAGHEMDHPLGTAGPVPAAVPLWMLPGLAQRRRLLDPRLLMTAAMAFFSLALTLSLVGVHITSVHAAELRPQAVQANVTRTFYGTKKQVVSFYENLRLVYEVESKMQDLRRDVEQAPAAAAPQREPATSPAPEKQPGATPAKPGGKLSPRGAAAVHGRAAAEPLRGWPEAVSCRPTAKQGSAAGYLLRAAAFRPYAVDNDSSAAQPISTGATSKERIRI